MTGTIKGDITFTNNGIAKAEFSVVMEDKTTKVVCWGRWAVKASNLSFVDGDEIYFEGKEFKDHYVVTEIWPN